jgi:hypothetical protein
MPSGCRIISRQGGGRIGIVCASVKNPIAQTDDGTKVGMTGTAKPNNFTTDSVLLCGER